MLRTGAVMEALGVTRPTVDEMIRRGVFPAGLRIGVGRNRAWREADVLAFLASREAEARR
jgi:predicted DNA-binding transcriptional regulator AlpA